MRRDSSLAIVRLLLFLALATVGVALALYFFKRDRRYLRFIGQVAKFTLIVLVVVLLFFAGERLLDPSLRRSDEGPPRSLRSLPPRGAVSRLGRAYATDITHAFPRARRDQRDSDAFRGQSGKRAARSSSGATACISN